MNRSGVKSHSTGVKQATVTSVVQLTDWLATGSQHRGQTSQPILLQVLWLSVQGWQGVSGYSGGRGVMRVSKGLVVVVGFAGSVQGYVSESHQLPGGGDGRKATGNAAERETLKY
ncbi:hypothetical protein E2C01_051938 [Portunus trituberculatus]|uniref:Uncharacterized protein n=1 Tax=Portunus trituberculatus TaxID=210409 RepID=A0A5B7GK75_PORTR|nr:hypothetical protein [Portunus trituberculatus]